MHFYLPEYLFQARNVKEMFPAVCRGDTCAPVLCIVGDWCTALPRGFCFFLSQIKILLEFIFINFQNIFVSWYGWHLVLIARCSFCFVLESLVLLFYCFVTSHCSKHTATKIMDSTSAGTAFVVFIYQLLKNPC